MKFLTPPQHEFTMDEILIILLKEKGIHEGYWQLAMSITFAPHNVRFGEGSPAMPGAILGANRLALRKVDKLVDLCVDAAKVNPKKKGARGKAR